jgi:hypothetical protein
MYNDDYETCARTYVTLRIYPEKTSVAEITELLGIEPSFTENNDTSDSSSKKVWLLSTNGQVISKDIRRHLDFLLDQLLPLKAQIKALEKDQAQLDISCFWQSQHGQGGPTLSDQQLSKLAELGIEIWFDFY